MTSLGLARERLSARNDAAGYIAWLRREPRFRDRVLELHAALEHERQSETESSSNPEPLGGSASDAHRSARFLDSVLRLSSVLPPSARGFWPLLLDEGLDLVVGPGRSLTDEEWKRLTTVARSRLRDRGPENGSGELNVADADFLERTLLRIDPAAPVLMPAAWTAEAATSPPREVAA